MVSHIVACSINNVIGLKGTIPWHIKEDLQRFKQLTTGNPVIMGRKTFESMGAPLIARPNCIITHNPCYIAPKECLIIGDIRMAIKYYQDQGYEDIFIIGGEEIYKQSIQYINKIYLTKINMLVDGDAFYPPIPRNFEEIERITPKQEYTFITYIKE